MKQIFTNIVALIMVLFSWSQQDFHVFPKNHKTTPGSPEGNGSLTQPWDLQTALSQNAKIINGGDTIYLHEGVYLGRFISLLSNTKRDSPIEVMPFKGEKVVLNGNVKAGGKAVLVVRGGGVTFRNFEITFKGKFPRRQGEEGFQIVSGVDHLSGMDCKFKGLRIHNVPGSGFGSWKRTGGTQIVNCKIYNNGYFSTKRGSGVGIYVQNESDKTRIIKNNFIFNNYYKGIQVWSASSRPKFEYVKNVRLENNVVFNNGLPGNKHVDNIIIASDDRQGLNVPKNVVVRSNILYHNIDFNDKSDGKLGPSLTIGYRHTSPAKNIVIDRNIIIGKSYPVRVLHAKTMKFTDNIIAGGAVFIRGSNLTDLNAKNWTLSQNKYYTYRKAAIRIEGQKNYSVDEFNSRFSPKSGSYWSSANEITLPAVLFMNKNSANPERFDMVLFEKSGKDVTVNFTKESIKIGTPYRILDMADGSVIKEGVVNRSKSIVFPMGTRNGTEINFGVYEVEFSGNAVKRRGFIGRLLERLF
ncbi:MAG: right-handed parallel beta-helix repeat-containing protein [Flavobacteriaceae bacterium]|nr:right-handed parallel beta-helix repeat-containing protein [Bacteroidia bacterium]NNF76136.1 right-handed parallel beta-helix repeat-containing protein [Flavobacteriaceae bacterium]NNK72926.1 right-handed parallel beta-helix repeat-containing protein [Flavobacteriaceae bacterium]